MKTYRLRNDIAFVRMLVLICCFFFYILYKNGERKWFFEKNVPEKLEAFQFQ